MSFSMMKGITSPKDFTLRKLRKSLYYSFTVIQRV